MKPGLCVSISADCWEMEVFLWDLIFVCTSGSRSGGLEGSIWGDSWVSVRGREEELDQFSAGCGPQLWCFLSLPGQCWPCQTGKHPLLVTKLKSLFPLFMHLIYPCTLVYLSPKWFVAILYVLNVYKMANERHIKVTIFYLCMVLEWCGVHCRPLWLYCWWGGHKCLQWAGYYPGAHQHPSLPSLKNPTQHPVEYKYPTIFTVTKV